MLITASNFTATSVNRVFADSNVGLNSTSPEKTQVLPRTVVLDPSTLLKLKQDFNEGNNTMLGLSLHALVTPGKFPSQQEGNICGGQKRITTKW